MKTLTDELLPLNIMLLGLTIGCEEYNTIIIPIIRAHDDGVTADIPYKETWEIESMSESQIRPIPLEFGKKILKDMGIEFESLGTIPPVIEFLHQLQNWYYFNFGKELINIEQFDDNDGDYWIDITKEFYQSEIGKKFLENSAGIVH